MPKQSGHSVTPYPLEASSIHTEVTHCPEHESIPSPMSRVILEISPILETSTSRKATMLTIIRRLLRSQIFLTFVMHSSLGSYRQRLISLHAILTIKCS